MSSVLQVERRHLRWRDLPEEAEAAEDSDEDLEEFLTFYCKPAKAAGDARMKFHVQSSHDPARTACPKGGLIKDLVLVAEETVETSEICFGCMDHRPELYLWVQAQRLRGHSED